MCSYCKRFSDRCEIFRRDTQRVKTPDRSRFFVVDAVAVADGVFASLYSGTWPRINAILSRLEYNLHNILIISFDHNTYYSVSRYKNVRFARKVNVYANCVCLGIVCTHRRVGYMRNLRNPNGNHVLIDNVRYCRQAIRDRYSFVAHTVSNLQTISQSPFDYTICQIRNKLCIHNIIFKTKEKNSTLLK